MAVNTILKNVIFGLALILITFQAYSQSIKTIYTDFTKIIVNQNSNDTVKGKVYYFDNSYTIQIDKPINQWMIFKNDNVLIYYPDNKNAIEIKNKKTGNSSFHKNLPGLFNLEATLSNNGYAIEKNEFLNDTLFVHWKPPKEMEKILKNYCLGLKENKIVSMKIVDTDGNVVNKTTFEDFIQHGDRYFPLNIKSIINLGKETEQIIFRYSNFVFNNPLPIEIKNFKIPSDIKIQVIEW